MTQQAHSYVPGTADAGAEIARLRQVLALIEEIAGSGPASPEEGAMDEAARVSAAYAEALPIHQKRFDSLASETARWAATGVEALLTLEERRLPVRPAAARLGEELRRALSQLAGRLPG
jgi:hypothetical protein